MGQEQSLVGLIPDNYSEEERVKIKKLYLKAIQIAQDVDSKLVRGVHGRTKVKAYYYDKVYRPIVNLMAILKYFKVNNPEIYNRLVRLFGSLRRSYLISRIMSEGWDGWNRGWGDTVRSEVNDSD